MPIKLPKTFARRKSAGNVLEEAFESSTPTESTFRVLPRGDDTNFSHNRNVGGRPNSSPNQRWPDDSFDDGPQRSNRCDSQQSQAGRPPLMFDSTYKSSSTENTSASDRYSYQSTEPSSVESRSQDDLAYHNRKLPLLPVDAEESPVNDERPQQKHRFSLTAAAGRTFPFPRPKFSKSGTSPSRNESHAPVDRRERSTTETSYSSYASTAQPPRLDLGLGLGSSEGDSASNWFNSTTGRHMHIMEEPIAMDPPLPPKPAARSVCVAIAIGDQLLTHDSQDSDSMLATSKQFSWEEHDERRARPLTKDLQKSPPPDRRWPAQFRQPFPSPRRAEDLSPSELPRRSWESNQSDHEFISRGASKSSNIRSELRLQTTSPVVERSQLSPPEPQESPTLNARDDEALLDSIAASSAFEQQFAPKPAQCLPDRSRASPNPPRNQTSSFQGSTQSTGGRTDSLHSSNATTPKAQPAVLYHDDNAPLYDTSNRRDMYPVKERASMIPQGNKVMTKAEFEKYKQSAPTHEDDDNSQHSNDSDAYEDEDENERKRQLAKQRRKQEAHLAVYRQQMMKVTGEQPSDLPSLTSGRPTVSRSTHSLPSLASIPTLDPKAQGEISGRSSDDEDEDVPLGVLQAHGFPSKSRPPTRLTSASTAEPRSESQMSTYPQSTGATRIDPTAGGAGNTGLPPFARNLPRDPYVGASLVDQPTRQSLRQSYSYQPSPHQSSSHLPPGGLVGVIAGEERAKAMRRGSPNVNGTYGPSGPPTHQMGMPQMPHPGLHHQQMGMPFMPPQQQYTPSEEAQMEMNKSMTQMMQTQMQWMQQMMQMQGGQGVPLPPGMQLPPGMMQDMQQTQAGMQQSGQSLSPRGFEQQNNRESMQSAASSTNGYQNQHQRSGSAMSHKMSGGRSGSFIGLSYNSAGSGYAPSIAPSERSNVGQPSRYRTVTPSGPMLSADTRNSRTNTMSQASASTNNLLNPRSRSPEKLGLPTGPGQGLGAVVNPPSTVRAVSKPRKGTGGSDDEEDNAAWADMRKRREERRSRWSARKKEKEDAELPKGGLEGLYYDA